MLSSFDSTFSNLSESKSTTVFDQVRAGYAHRYKLQLTKLKMVYMRLLDELCRYAHIGKADYLQVVWKEKLYHLCELLSIDFPRWLPFHILSRLADYRFIFSDLTHMIPPMERDDREYLRDMVLLLIRHWDRYIENEQPTTNEEVLLCLIYEHSSMKDFYRTEFTLLGMINFVKPARKAFQVTGRECSEDFHRNLKRFFQQNLGYSPDDIKSIIEYRQGT
jgi:hypothetical protein